MSKVLSPCSPWSRHLQKTIPSCRYMAETTSSGEINVPRLAAVPEEFTIIDTFRERSFERKKPVVFGKDHGSPTPLLPALNKWFAKDAQYNSTTLSDHVGRFRDAIVPYEIYAPTQEQRASLDLFRDSLGQEETRDEVIGRSWDSWFEGHAKDQDFFRFDAPLGLFTKVLKFNQVLGRRGLPRISLYIAQCSITDLPPALQEDIPTPEIVRRAGKGDIYGSSIWLGIAPTYTPLHRDPNPNIFCQLSGTKVIRLMTPKAGDWLFGVIQAELHRSGSSRIRTEEMMQGEERDKLHHAVWEADPVPRGSFEVVLDPGDAMFIPAHYWHSVKSVGEKGDLNGSVNWWFR